MAKTLHRLITALATAVAAVGLLTVAPATADVSPYIVGGTRASIGQYPWTVYLASSSGGQFCGGTLVSGNKVVTAAHCTSGRSPSSTRVVWGREDKQSTAGVVASVTRIWIHPSYRSATSGYDVSVLTLDRNISSSYLPLATPSDTSLYAAGTNATILGWGTTSSGGSASRYLLKATVPVTSDATCRQAYPQYSNTSMVCAGYPQGGTDTCQGDSGGPLVAGGKLIGATSWGRGCASAGYPGVYARIASYHSVLTQQINS
ncbi:secreted trypsin-like serine protease [Saccharothrix tamanrassetensis]|uniref:Secreted trypsin-like serine protease n=1 Tax=Saccharothrix tamanrassetensis TaxID=1051531 RepID=A0A841CF60_9PSEU|nr:serine protease [Saccharothrix tamanrassetensis]MBB5955620.1 secreted trypsin-like serine protease [Saccharothrix tamanrassetensis]